MRITQKKIILILIITVVFVYGIFQARNYILGPKIDLESPADGASFKDKLLVVKGRAQNVSHIALDGRAIFTDKDGNFSEEVLLAPGLNFIIIEAKDKFGAKTFIRRQVTREVQM